MKNKSTLEGCLAVTIVIVVKCAFWAAVFYAALLMIKSVFGS